MWNVIGTAIRFNFYYKNYNRIEKEEYQYTEILSIIQ